MSAPAILILKRGAASKRDIELVRNAGVAVLEVNDPNEVRYMDPPLEPTTRIQALCFRMVEELLKRDGSYLQAGDIKKRIIQMVLDGEQPPKATGIARLPSPAGAVGAA